MGMKRTRAALLLAALAALGCGRKEPPENASVNVAPPMAQAPRVEIGASAELDSGNVAYRAKDFRAALAHYRTATERQPTLAAAWFGLYMAQSAVGDKAAADSALRRVQALEPGLVGAHPAPGASGAPQGGAALPPGHPATAPAQMPPGHPTTSGSR